MSEIDAIEAGGQASVFPSSFEENSKESETDTPVVSTYQDPGPNSGVTRMRQEEVMNCAIAPNLSQLTARKSLCRRLEAFFLAHATFDFEKDCCYKLLAEKMAPHNTVLAKEMASKVRSRDKRDQAYIEISKHQSDEEARATLLNVRDPLLVYREEKRRDFPEAETTFEKVKDCAKGGYGLCELAQMQLEYALPGFEDTLQRAHHDTFQYVNGTGCGSSTLNQYPLLSLLAVEGKAQSPLVWETLERLRENVDKIRHELLTSDYDYDEAYTERQCLSTWRKILKVEAQTPFLRAQFEEDLLKVLAMIKSMKEKFSDEEDLWETSMYTHDIFESILVHDLESARRIFSLVEKQPFVIDGQIALAKCNTSMTKSDLEEVAKQVEELSFWRHAEYYTQLFELAADKFGLEVALPYLEKAKLAANKVKEDPNYDPAEGEFTDALLPVLKAETAYLLLSRRETLQLFHEEGYFATDEILLAILDAEFSLV